MVQKSSFNLTLISAWEFQTWGCWLPLYLWNRFICLPQPFPLPPPPYSSYRTNQLLKEVEEEEEEEKEKKKMEDEDFQDVDLPEPALNYLFVYLII